LRGREHLLLGAGSVLVVGVGVQFTGVQVPTGMLIGTYAAAAAGSLAPDLDHPGSLASLSIPSTLLVYGGGFLLSPMLTRLSPKLAVLDLSGLPPVYRSAAWLSVILAVLLFGLSIAARSLFPHRGPVHSLAFGAAATLSVVTATLILSGSLWIPLAFAWGWATHLAADATTKMGLPHLLWPFDEDRPV